MSYTPMRRGPIAAARAAADTVGMLSTRSWNRLAALAAMLAVAAAGVAARAETPARADAPPAAKQKPPLDHSGRARVGKASFYARQFFGRKMADGTPMNPHDDNAASRTLPLGTTAVVTNLETGLSAVVTIQDRGPYVDGRIVDLSPATARQIGITPRAGLARVEVAPIAVPQPDGSMKAGAAVQRAGLG
jgi:rare lipoprotein A